MTEILSSSVIIVSSSSSSRRRWHRYPSSLITRGWNHHILVLVLWIITLLFDRIIRDDTFPVPILPSSSSSLSLSTTIIVGGVSAAFVPIRIGRAHNSVHFSFQQQQQQQQQQYSSKSIRSNSNNQFGITYHVPTPSVLFATTKSSENQKKKKLSSSSSGSNGFGTGFGSSTSSSSSNKKSRSKQSSSASSSSIADNNNNNFQPQNNNNNQQQQQQLRSISGKQMGMGNKALRDAVNTYDTVRKVNGVENCSYDVYIRSPKNDPNVFWFVGKVAIDTANAPEGVSIVDACLAQKRIIFEYSKLHLRPQNFGGIYTSSLELWYVPEAGDKEMDIVQNKVPLRQIIGNAQSIHPNFTIAMCGYNPELYLGDEQTQGGLRVKRNTNGDPIDPVFDVYAGQ